MRNLILLTAIALYFFMPDKVNLTVHRNVALPVAGALVVYSIASPRRW